MSTGQLQASLGAPCSSDSCCRVDVAPWPRPMGRSLLGAGEKCPTVTQRVTGSEWEWCVMCDVQWWVLVRCHHVMCPARSQMSNMSIFAILTFQFSWHWANFQWLILQCYHSLLLYFSLLDKFKYYHFNKQDGKQANSQLSKIKIFLNPWNLYVILLNPGQRRFMIFQSSLSFKSHLSIPFLRVLMLNKQTRFFNQSFHEINMKSMSRCGKVEWAGQVDQLIWQIINLHSGARFANTQQPQQRTAHCTNMHRDTYY